jgi:hypothetical protein
MIGIALVLFTEILFVSVEVAWFVLVSLYEIVHFTILYVIEEICKGSVKCLQKLGVQ